jgi:hypothetical protein
MNKKFVVKEFILITLIVSLWVNASELVRYFGYVRPRMQEYFSYIPQMGKIWDIQILAVWGFWDALITALYVFLFWLCAQVFGNTRKAIVISGVMSWSFVFVLYWVATANMFLAEWSTLFVVLPLALLETLVASYIASKLYLKKSMPPKEKA